MNHENCPIRAYQNDLTSLSNRAEAMRPIVQACQDASERAGLRTSVILRTEEQRVRIAITIMPKNLDELIPLFRELAKEGLHTNKRKPFTDHSFEGILGMREYDLGDVTINALIFNPSEEEAEGRCRLVQTGTKEVPVFEMKCD